jgi:hypothetical protein
LLYLFRKLLFFNTRIRKNIVNLSVQRLLIVVNKFILMIFNYLFLLKKIKYQNFMLRQANFFDKLTKIKTNKA